MQYLQLPKDGSWLDEAGIPYIYFSNEEAAALLRVSERKITTLKNVLIKAGLIQVLRHGLKNYRIYVSNPKAPEKGMVVQLSFKNYMSTKTLTPVENSVPEKKPSYPLWIDKQNLRLGARKICLQVHKNN